MTPVDMIGTSGYDRWLSKASTCFYIMAYEDIFCHTDSLFRVLQAKAMDIGFCCARIPDTIAIVEHMRQEFGNFYEQFEQRCSALGLTDNERSQSKTLAKDERKQKYSGQCQYSNAS